MGGMNFRERSQKKPNVLSSEEWSAEDDALPIEPKNDFAFQRNQQTIYNFGYRQLSSQKLEGAIKEFLDLEATLGTSINDV